MSLRGAPATKQSFGARQGASPRRIASSVLWTFLAMILLVILVRPFIARSDDGTLKLEQNHPNPFNSWTVIKFSTPAAGNVQLRVYNMLGKEVAVIVNDDLEPDDYTRRFDASQLPSGQYTYTLLFTAGGTQTKLTKKMYLVK